MNPLVPHDIDLRGLPFMPLDVNRLRDSELAIKASGDAFRAAVLLWCASWNQMPAASLPNDDRDLAAYAGFGRDLQSWLEVKGEAMRGFVLCDDGRLYHPVVAEKALEAWTGRKEYREVKENENDRKRRERAWKKAAYAALRDIGIVPAWNEKTSAVRDLCAKHGITIHVTDEPSVTPSVTELVTVTSHGPVTPPVTQPVTAPVTPPVTVTGHAPVTAKRETGTGRETGTVKALEEQEPPIAPKGGAGTEPRQKTFKTWIASLPPGDDAIPEDHHVFAYADRVGIPRDFLALAWQWFQRKYGQEKPRHCQIDWPAHFRNAVEGRWGKLWYFDATGACQLTTDGEQLRRSAGAAA